MRKMGSQQASQPAGCPKTKWVLVGYSQGAMVARWVDDAVPSKVASRYLVGDPFQKGNQPGTRGGGANGTGVMRWNYPWASQHLDSYYSTRPSDASTFCHNNDPVCDFGLYGTEPHANYFTEDSEKKTEGRVLANIVNRLRTTTTSVPGLSADSELSD